MLSGIVEIEKSYITCRAPPRQQFSLCRCVETRIKNGVEKINFKEKTIVSKECGYYTMFCSSMFLCYFFFSHFIFQ